MPQNMSSSEPFEYPRFRFFKPLSHEKSNTRPMLKFEKETSTRFFGSLVANFKARKSHAKKKKNIVASMLTLQIPGTTVKADKPESYNVRKEETKHCMLLIYALEYVDRKQCCQC